MVEPASDFLMSSLPHAMIAPNNSADVTTMATAISAYAECARIGLDRTIRYTPAVTMVAAWISADTGVGPSMASSSQDWSGSWADLPQAASSSSRPSARPTPEPPDFADANTPVKLNVPNSANISMIASDRPASPILLAMNAFFAAAGGACLDCQNPISR